MDRARRGLASLSVRGVSLTTRGWWFVAAAAVAFIGAYSGGRLQVLYVACLLLALPVFGLIVVWVRRPRLIARRSFSPRVIQAGSVTTVSLQVSNTGPAASLRARWWDDMPWQPGVTPESDLPALQPRGVRFAGKNATTVSYEVAPPRRGIFPVGPATVQVMDAFGLASCRTSVGGAEPLTVTPEVIALPDTGLLIPAGDGQSRLVQRRAAGDDDDAMTREYRDGDALRRVHWRASARAGDLMVRQEEQRSDPEARLVVDTTRSGFRDVDGDDSDSFEWVVRMLASIAVHLRRAGFRVTIEESGVAQLDALGRDRRRTWGDEDFLARLASVHLTDAVARGARQGPTTGPVFAVVGSPTPETVEWMLGHRRADEFGVVFVVRSFGALDHVDRSFGVPPGSTTMDEVLTDAGWLVVPVRADDDHAVAWHAVVAELGRSRGGG